jgi:hypothetical protein
VAGGEDADPAGAAEPAADAGGAAVVSQFECNGASGSESKLLQPNPHRIN